MSSEPRTDVVRGCQITMLVLAIFGITGNVLSFITLCGKSLRYQTTTACLQALAIADILVLITCIFRYRVYYLFLTDDQYIHSVFNIDAYFEVYIEPIYWMSLGIASMITLLVTAERYVAIRFPLRIRTRNCRGISTVLLFCVISIPIFLTLPNFFYYTVETFYFPFSNTSVKIASITPFGDNDNYRCIYFKYIIPFLWYIIPWICLAILNILLVCQVVKSAKVSQGISETVNATSRRHNRNLTILMIFIVLAFLIFNLPKCITVFLRMFQSDNNDVCEPGSSGNEQQPETPLDVAEWIVSVLNTANSTVNFIFYCVIGERFRRQFRKTFCCCTCHKRFTNATTTNTAQGNESVI